MTRGQLAGLRVLVVDDHQPTLEGLCELLGREGAVVQGASEGADALDLHRRNRHEVVVSDLDMPGMDGFGLADRIRAMEGAGRPSCRLIAFTGMLMGSPTEVLWRGFDHVVSKPDFDTLLRLLSNVASSVGRRRRCE